MDAVRLWLIPISPIILDKLINQENSTFSCYSHGIFCTLDVSTCLDEDGAICLVSSEISLGMISTYTQRIHCIVIKLGD